MGMGSKEPYVSMQETEGEGPAGVSPLKEEWYSALPPAAGQPQLRRRREGERWYIVPPIADDTGKNDGYQEQWTSENWEVVRVKKERDDTMRSRSWIPWVLIGLVTLWVTLWHFAPSAHAEGSFAASEKAQRLAQEQVNRIERAPTRLEAMPAVTAQAAVLAAKYTGRAPLEVMPEVVFMPSKVIEARYCAEAVKRHDECRAKRVVALHDNKTIYLDEHLDPVLDEIAFSILLHEMVHMLQERDKAYPNTCLDAFELEKEAALAQVQFLRDRSNIMSSTVYNSLRFYRCPQ